MGPWPAAHRKKKDPPTTALASAMNPSEPLPLTRKFRFLILARADAIARDLRVVDRSPYQSLRPVGVPPASGSSICADTTADFRGTATGDVEIPLP